jgi:hypothetical protein
MRSSRASKWLLSAAALLLLAAPAQAQQKRIVGGTSGDRVPYQAGLVPSDGDTEEVYCGAVVRDATHVMTAAHCVTFSGGDDPSEVDVIADVVNVVNPEPTLQRVPVAAIGVHPDYDEDTDRFDAAVLTLAEPLDLDAALPSLVDPRALALTLPASGSSAVVSGWGATDVDGEDFQPELKWVEVKLLDDSDCALHDGYDPQTMLCAGDPPGTDDSCRGDSGGPLVEGADLASAGDLIGLVSFGGNALQLCGSTTHPGVYTRVSEPSIRSFLLSEPVPRPRNTSPPAILGTPEVGQVLTCEAGAWEGGQPIVFDRQWRGTATASTAPQYTATEADAGKVLSCLVRASNGGGAVQAISPTVVVATPAAPPPQAPAPPPPPPPSPPPALDTTLPRSIFSSRRCAARRCRFVLLVTDLGGVAGATVRVTRRRLGGFAPRTLRAVRRAAGRYVIRTPRLRPGRYTFSAVVTDAAGNRQARATRVTLRIRR